MILTYCVAVRQVPAKSDVVESLYTLTPPPIFPRALQTQMYSAAKEHDITIHVAIYQRQSYRYCTANSFLLLKRHHQIKKNMTTAHAI